MTIDQDMLTEPWTYLALLKGKQAEYDALRELNLPVRRQVTPLLLLREAGGAATVADLAAQLDRLRIDWGDQGPVILDGEWLTDPTTFRLALEAARSKGWVAVPSARLTDPDTYVEVVRLAALNVGAVLRLSRADFASGEIEERLGSMLDAISLAPERVDLVLDLRNVEWTHLGADTLAVENMIGQLPTPTRWRHLAVASSSIPPDFRGFARNEITRVPRAEAWLYEALFDRRRLMARLPVYADYVVANPDPVEEVHADYLPQNALLRYSTSGDWLFARGYDINKEGSGHIPPLLSRLMKEEGFRDASFSAGDRWIVDAASGDGASGNATIWRRAGSSHHMTLVTQQIASQFSS